MNGVLFTSYCGSMLKFGLNLCRTDAALIWNQLNKSGNGILTCECVPDVCLPVQ